MFFVGVRQSAEEFCCPSLPVSNGVEVSVKAMQRTISMTDISSALSTL